MCRQALNTATCGAADCVAMVTTLGSFVMLIALTVMTIYITANVSDNCLTEEEIADWIVGHFE